MRKRRREATPTVVEAPTSQGNAAVTVSPTTVTKQALRDTENVILHGRLSRKRIAPSLTVPPVTPLPLWQRVTLSVLESRREHLSEEQNAISKRNGLAKDLAKYHGDVIAREARVLRAQREARARAGEKLSRLVMREWQRRGDAYERLAKVEFDIVKHRSDKRKQEDYLRETEELTKRLLHSIFSEKLGHTCDAELGHDTELTTEGSNAPDYTLSLLDTQQGKRPLRCYQRSALRWMIHLYENRLNGILADEMGLGKTVQTIALLCYYAEYKNDWGPHLIVVPTTVVLNWTAEFQRWAPGLKVLTYVGSLKERKKLRLGWTSEDAFHVCITSYNLVVQDRAVFRRRPWGFLVLDEAHQVKNFMSKKWQSLFDLQAEYRLLLTGTPLQNSMMELWSLFHFLLPSASAFRSAEEFKEWFSNPLDDMVTGKANLNEDVVRRLQGLLRPFMLRRLKKDVESQLPSKVEKVVLCQLSRRQRSLYDDYMQLAETRQRLSSGGSGAILSVLLALRKVCNHPDMFEERPTVSPFALSYADTIQIVFPRAVLMLGNCYRRRFCFPRLQIWDVNDDARQLGTPGEDQDDDTDVFSWLPCRLLFLDWKHHSGVGRADMMQRSVLARYSTQHFPAPAATGTFQELMASTTERQSSALRQTFVSAYQRASATATLRYERTCAFQQLRYQMEEAASINTYYPRLCHVTLKAALLGCISYLCPTISQRVEALRSLIAKIAIYVPPVLARSPQLWCTLPVWDMSSFVPLGRPQCAELMGCVARQLAPHNERIRCRGDVFDGSFFLSELWPFHVRRCFSFPDRRLLIHDCGKLQFLEKTLKQLRQEGHRMLIFTQFVHMLNILERFLAMVGISYLRIDGSTRVDLRQTYVDRFNADERIVCMILSTRSGGIGLNLTGADTVIFYDSDWNPTMDLQAQDRCHRIGQTKPVTIYRLISEHTVEENILRKAHERKKLNNVVIRGGQFHALAGVHEAYDDSTAAFAAMATPVNLRSFFHDLDEDATVPTEAMPTSEDVLQEMRNVEDDEDHAAQQQVEEELRQLQAEAEAEVDDNEGMLLDGSPSSNLEGRLNDIDDVDNDSSASLERCALRKRQRELLRMMRSPLDRLLAVRYGVCREDEARSMYETLCDGYASCIMGNPVQLPPFRKEVMHINCAQLGE